MNKVIHLSIFFFALNLACYAQTPPNGEAEKVTTEEIKVNVSVTDRAGNFVADVRAEDLVIDEDGRLHQASSVRLIAPSVLIALDTGGANRLAKNIQTTRKIAGNLIGTFAPNAHIAVMQFHDKIEFLSDWQTDRTELLRIVENRTNFGRRSSFVGAIAAANDFLAAAPTENRHLILITDATDSRNDEAARAAAIKKLLTGGAIVHVVSYAPLELAALAPQTKIIRKGEPNPRRLPPEIELAILGAGSNSSLELARLRRFPPRLLSVLTDYPFWKEKNSQTKALIAAQIQLVLLAETTGGEIVMPESIEEVLENSTTIARSINSQYVVTYAPKRPLKDAPTGEIRQIEASSRRIGLEAHGARRLTVFGTENGK